MPAKMDLISIVIPLYNEEEVVRETYKRTTAVLESLQTPYEMIFVDDSSTDKTFEILMELSSRDPRVKALSFSRNFGHQAALTAGLDHSRGDAVVTMDGDLQHPPELIPELLKKWREGFEVVYTIREYDESEGFFKRATSSFFYSIINSLAQITIPANAADFRLYDRKVVEGLKSLRERNRFLRGLSAWVGFRQTGVNYKAARRLAGTSKYSVRKMIKFAIDGITSFSIFPLKLSIYLGFTVSFLSFLYLAYVLYVRLVTERSVPGWASTTIAMLFLGGVQLIAIGILGEYIGRIYEEIKARPPYIVTRSAGFPEGSGTGAGMTAGGAGGVGGAGGMGRKEV